jgi:hypothetical protein
MKTNTKRISGLVLFLIMFISSSIITGQTTFQKIYSSTKGQSGRDVVSTADGGYIIVGLTIGGDSDIYIVKTNNIGDIHKFLSKGISFGQKLMEGQSRIILAT